MSVESYNNELGNPPLRAIQARLPLRCAPHNLIQYNTNCSQLLDQTLLGIGWEGIWGFGVGRRVGIEYLEACGGPKKEPYEGGECRVDGRGD